MDDDTGSRNGKFAELVRFTLVGYIAGLLVGVGLDAWGYQRSAWGLYAARGFFIPYFYAMSEQIGANVSGLIFTKRRGLTWPAAWSNHLRQPSMAASLGIIVLVPCGLPLARLLGYGPTSQMSTALATIAANVCWFPPLVGWLGERHQPVAGNRNKPIDS